MKQEDIARIAHEVNRTYCLSIGDDTQVPWEEAPAWQRRSAILGVDYHLTTPGVTPEDMHNSWAAQKESDGWKLGPKKDPERKLHPCLVPYKELPLEQKVKDHLFATVVDKLAPFLEEAA